MAPDREGSARLRRPAVPRYGLAFRRRPLSAVLDRGQQLGADDERDLFPQALRLVEECEPIAVMLENVRGLATGRFAGYREQVVARLEDMGYQVVWQVLNACEFGVPQLRPRFILVALVPEVARYFQWPNAERTP